MDIIKAANRPWRDMIKEHDTKWHWIEKKYPNYDINSFIIKNYPELKEQFEWEQLTANQRMIRMFGHIKTTKFNNHYAGNFNNSKYDPDLDPFFDKE